MMTEPVPTASRSSLAVVAEGNSDSLLNRATELAKALGLPLAQDVDLRNKHAVADYPHETILVVTEERLELRLVEKNGPSPVFVDFIGGRIGYNRHVNRFGHLFQAIGLQRGVSTIVDATAGLAEDAFLMAYNGCSVTAIERSPVIGALISDGLERGLMDDELREILQTRLHLIVGDAKTILHEMSPADAPDVVYLDPMYPPKKKTALVKKEMRVCRKVVGDDDDADKLFEAAMAIAKRRVVVKRMQHAPELAPNPSLVFSGKTTRYDVYLCHQ